MLFRNFHFEIRGRPQYTPVRAVAGEQGDQAPLGVRALGGGPMGQQLFLEALPTKGLTAPPAARVTDDFLIPVIKRHRETIGFDDEALAHEMRWGTVAIAIELQAKILLHQGLGGVAVIRSEGWERSQTVRAEAIARSLAAFTVQSLVGKLRSTTPAPGDSHRGCR